MAKEIHTTGKTLQESLKVQEPYRKGTIQKVMGTDTGKKLTTVSQITDPDTISKIKSGEIKYVSPAVFPKSLEDVEIIKTGPDSHIHVLHRYNALHRAFVDEPAYGTAEATVGPTCEGDGEQCTIKLEQVQAGIGDDDIAPIQEKKIVSVKKCTVTGNTIVEFANTSDIQEKNTTSNLPTDSETIKQLEAKLAKANEEKEELKKSNDELTEEKKKSEEAKKAMEEEKKEKDMTARISAEIAKKLPLIDKFIAAKVHVANLDEKAQAELRDTMMKASLEEVEKSWNDVKDFVAAIPMKPEQASSPIRYGLGTGYFVASANYSEKSTDELLKLAGVEA